MVSKRDLNSVELETTRISKNPTTVTANGEVQTREEGNSVCQRIGLICDGNASWRNTGSSFSRKALRGSWVYLPLDQRSKTTSHPKWQENLLQDLKLCTIRSPWFIDEFLYNAHTYFFIIFITGFCDLHGKTSSRKKWDYERGVTAKRVAWISRNRKHK